MILELTGGGVATILDRCNFKALAVHIMADRQDLDLFARMFAPLIRFEGSDHVWLGMEAVIGLLPGDAHAEWRGDFLRMVEKAKPYGWVDIVEGTVRAHVVWHG